MNDPKPIEVTVIGGGCAAIAAAFELTRPEHRGRYHVTIYQLGWRLGGKGASGRGPAERVEEHGLHLWLGYYENAFRLLRECYAELDRDPATCRFADWRDAFRPDPEVALADDAPDGTWRSWTACFPMNDELPGDPYTSHHPFTLTYYLVRSTDLLRTLLVSVATEKSSTEAGPQGEFFTSGYPQGGGLLAFIDRILRYGQLVTLASLVDAIRALEMALELVPGPPRDLLLQLIDMIGAGSRDLLEKLLESDDELRQLWSIVDLMLAILRGVIRAGLANDPRGLDAINDFDGREWLARNGASERTLDSAFVRSLYDLSFAYEDADPAKPRLAAGQGLRGFLRLFFTYRGALFWKMQAGMGDVVFAPFYEVLKKRGVSFRFFHRLENVRLADPVHLKPGERPYVEALEFDVQAEIRGDAEYEPLVDVLGLPCWPAEPDWRQLKNGERKRREGWDFESHWDQRKVRKRTLRVTEDFDFVVLGVGLGAIPFVCPDFLERDARWRAMVDQIGTVATQAFQLWMDVDLEELGWRRPGVNMTGFVEPFDTWADMRQLLDCEDWPSPGPRSITYFCNVLPTPEGVPDRSEFDYPTAKRDEVQENAVRFLNRDMPHFWPRARRKDGQFRWEVLTDSEGRPAKSETASSAKAEKSAKVKEGAKAKKSTKAKKDAKGEECFMTQFWTANVNPSDRYVLSLPGTQRFRISPLDNTYDNLTVAGDWTDCGHNQGCVEAAVISGRLAAHAISRWPRLEDIIGYDHP